MSQEIDLNQLNDSADALRTAVDRLEAGEIIAVPDEAGVLLLTLPNPTAGMEAILVLQEQLPNSFPLVAIAHPSVIHDYVANVSEVAEKLTRRCWPGPVALRVSTANADGLCSTWEKSAQNWGVTETGRAFIVPGEQFSNQLLKELSVPAIGLLITAEQFTTIDSKTLSLTFRRGEVPYPDGLTIVGVQGETYQLERTGIVSERILSRLTGEVYIFVCTGNTCRSPMAEAIFRKMLAEKLGCQDDELLDRGYTVISAGLAAYPGAPASSDAVRLLKESGIDLSSHESQPVTQELLLHCDHIYTMTQNHLDAILNSLPELADKAQLLSDSGKDVSDPIGAGLEEYAKCRDEIQNYLRTLLDQQTIR